MLALPPSLRRRGSALLLAALTGALVDGAVGDGRSGELAVAYEPPPFASSPAPGAIGLLAAPRGALPDASSPAPSDGPALAAGPLAPPPITAPSSVAFTAPRAAPPEPSASIFAPNIPLLRPAALRQSPSPRHAQVPPAAVDPVPGCAWQLAGTWSIEGSHIAGRLAGRVFRTSITFRQIDDQLVGTQSGERITLYGRCSLDDLDLEIWRGWDYIGRHIGRVAPDGLTIAAAWAVWSPDSMEGEATFSGRARRVR